MRATYVAAGAAAGAATMLRALAASGDARTRLRERQGRWDNHGGAARPWLWIHGASVGEANISIAVAHALAEHLGGVRLVVSTMTDTGRDRILREVGLEPRYFPIDFAPFVKRVLEPLAPRLFVAVETEIWPETLRLLAARRVPVVFVNARLSDESLPRYQRLLPLLKPLMQGVARVCARDDDAAERWVSLGVPNARLKVTGNIKFDLANYEEEDGVTLPLFARLAGSPTLLAASTHDGEEALAVDAFKMVRRPVATARLVLAPRHPGRAADVIALVRSRGLSATPWSEFEATRREGAWPANTDVVVLDQLGLLRRAYTGATAAFVGGSAVPGPGGHNLLEAAVAGCPMAAGRHLGNVSDQVRLLTGHDALRVVENVAGLSSFWIEVIAIPEHFRDRAAAARAAVPTLHGALDRCVGELLPLLGAAPERR